MNGDYFYVRDVLCPECGEEARVVPLDLSFTFSGTHCTGGVGGVYHPPGSGVPVTACCEVEVQLGALYE